MKERSTFIYCLLDPITGRPRYVGKTLNPERRYQDHAFKSPRPDQRYPVARWAAKLRAKGLRPIMRVVEVHHGDAWVSAEKRWIARLRKRYSDLLNIADGGQGGGSYTKSAEHRAKISAALTGRKHTKPRGPEWRAKLSRAHKGRPKPPVSAETRRKISLSLMGNTHTRGRTLAPEHRDAVVSVLSRPDVVRKAAAAKARWWVVTRPDGQEEVVHNLQRFAEANGLDAASLNKVANGRQGRKQHRGYRVRPFLKAA